MRGFPGVSLEHGTTGVNSMFHTRKRFPWSLIRAWNYWSKVNSMSHTRRGFPGLSLEFGNTGVK